jgi:5-methylcytosine-specific restriction protein A
MLIIQPYGRKIEYAAMIPIDDLAGIWQKQKDESARLIESGALGRQKKNHADNGNSPTIWLQSDKAPTVAAVLWSTPSVRDLVKRLPHGDATDGTATIDDTYDDLLGLDPALIGSDSPESYATKRSSVRRDPRVRRRVIERAKGQCERITCGVSRPFAGFLDVHHILGVRKADRVWNCVAICPSCHRDAHFAPNRADINAELLEYADRFRGRPNKP